MWLHHSWTPDKIKNLCIAGDLYVRAFKPIIIEDELPKGDEQASTSAPIQGPSPSSSTPVATCSAGKSYDDVDEVNSHHNNLIIMCMHKVIGFVHLSSVKTKIAGPQHLGTRAYYRTLRKRAHYGRSAHPPPPNFGLNFLLRSNIYSNMCPCVAASYVGLIITMHAKQP